jgi:hypothetical protein
MFARLRARLTYANVMATIAVFIALGGSSYAALKVTSRNVPKDALTGADIKNLTGKDVRNNSLTGADVKNLTSADVSDGKLLAEDFAPGQLPKGDKGDRGERGEQGAPGAALAYAEIEGSTPSIVAGRSKNVNGVVRGRAFTTMTQPGAYCINLADTVVPKNVVATITRIRGDALSGPNQLATSLNPATDITGDVLACPAGFQDAIVTVARNDARQDSDVFVVFN